MNWSMWQTCDWLKMIIPESILKGWVISFLCPNPNGAKRATPIAKSRWKNIYTGAKLHV